MNRTHFTCENIISTETPMFIAVTNYYHFIIWIRICHVLNAYRSLNNLIVVSFRIFVIHPIQNRTQIKPLKRGTKKSAKKEKISLTAINELISDLKRARFGSISRFESESIGATKNIVYSNECAGIEIRMKITRNNK